MPKFIDNQTALAKGASYEDGSQVKKNYPNTPGEPVSAGTLQLMVQGDPELKSTVLVLKDVIDKLSSIGETLKVVSQKEAVDNTPKSDPELIRLVSALRDLIRKIPEQPTVLKVEQPTMPNRASEGTWKFSVTGRDQDGKIRDFVAIPETLQ